MKAIILSSRSHGNEQRRYFVFLEQEKRIAEARSALVLKPGEVIKSNDPLENIGTAEIESDASGITVLNAFADRFSRELVKERVYLTGNENIDNTTRRMWTSLGACGSMLMRKLATAAPILVRFHNDADGSSGAYGLYKSINELAGRRKEIGYKHCISWAMQQSVSYSAYDANMDLMYAESYASLERPLLVMIDFGTSAESNLGLERVRDRFDIIWLDHHPVVPGFRGTALDSYINPWNFGGDSNYTAGMLACILSKTFSDLDTKEIENASLIGDFSTFARYGESGADLSLLLDLVTSDSKVAFGPATPNLTPYEIDRLVSDHEKRLELIGFAKTRLADTTDTALKAMKRYRAGETHIYVLDFEGIRDDQSKFPLPGRFSSKLLEKIEQMKKEQCVVVVHSGRYISIRVSRGLAGKVDLAGVIGSLRESYAELIEAGGGHMLASGIKLADKVEKAKVLREVVTLLRAQLGHSENTE